MDNRIVFFVTSLPIKLAIQQELCALGLTFPVVESTMEKTLSVAKEYVDAGAKIVVCNGSMAAYLNDKLVSHIVEIPYSSVELISAVREGLKHSEKIAVVGYESLVQAVEEIQRLFPPTFHIHTELVFHELDMEAAVHRLAGEGFRVFVGGRKPVEAAQKIGAIGINISINLQNIRHAIRESVRILQLQTKTESHYEIIRSLLNCVGEGVIGVDRHGVVNEVNAKASKLLGRERHEIVAQPLQSLFPDLAVDGVALGRIGKIGEVVSFYGRLLSINYAPVMIGGETTGAVLTLQESQQIQNMEYKIRQKSFARGHVAKRRISDILGKSKIMRDVKRDAVTYAQTESTVLITGETGTGKELFAQSVHNLSKRSNCPFVAINCASLPESLLESELFGYVRGAFTGASPEGKLGLFEMAHTGTVFLDEISELPLSSQTKLLRVLQEKEVFRLGDGKIIPIDIRIIAATNKELYSLVKKGRFREDLYFRLSVLILNIPPLRLRKEDIEEYSACIIKEKGDMLGKRMLPLSDQAVRLLQSYDWPGNIRELENVLERATVLSIGNELEMLPAIMHQCSATLFGEASGRSPAMGRMEEVKSQAILSALQDAGGNKTLAAKKLGISSATLWRRLKNLR